MNLATKIGVALFVVLAAALCMTTVLNYLRFEQTLRTLITQRIDVVAYETSQDLHAAMDLGLRLESMENLRGILERRAGMSPDIRNLSVLDCQGAPLATTAQSSQEAPDEPERFSRTAESDWIHFNRNTVTAGRMLHDNLGHCAGLLQIEADGETYQDKLGNASSEMWRSASLGLLAIIPMLALLAVLMRRRHRVFTELHEDLDDALAGRAGTGALHEGDVLTGNEMELISLYREIRDQLPRTDEEEDSVPPSAKKNA